VVVLGRRATYDRLRCNDSSKPEADMPSIRVTPEQLQSISGQLNSGAASIDGTLSQLANQVAPLGSDWAGPAQARFESLWQEWQTGARQVHEALTGIAQITAQASTTYADTEQQIASTFNT
jgi:WXG100 family type VII secretion target